MVSSVKTIAGYQTFDALKELVCSDYTHRDAGVIGVIIIGGEDRPEYENTFKSYRHFANLSDDIKQKNSEIRDYIANNSFDHIAVFTPLPSGGAIYYATKAFSELYGYEYIDNSLSTSSGYDPVSGDVSKEIIAGIKTILSDFPTKG